MPPLPTVANVIRVDFHQQLGEDLGIQNRYFWHHGGSGLTSADLLTWIGHAHTDFGPYAALLSADWELVSMSMTDLGSLSGPHAEAAVGLGGSVAGISEPAEVAFVHDFDISRRYRGGKPKWFQSGIPTGHLISEQRWDPTFATNLTGAFVSSLAAFNGHAPASASPGATAAVSYFSGFTVVLSPTTGRARNVPTLRVTPVVDDVNTIHPNPRPASQRRRGLQRS